MITILVFISWLGACTHIRYSPEIESVLHLAGKNRNELEKGLQRYAEFAEHCKGLRQKPLFECVLF